MYTHALHSALVWPVKAAVQCYTYVGRMYKQKQLASNLLFPFSLIRTHQQMHKYIRSTGTMCHTATLPQVHPPPAAARAPWPETAPTAPLHLQERPFSGHCRPGENTSTHGTHTPLNMYISTTSWWFRLNSLSIHSHTTQHIQSTNTCTWMLHVHVRIDVVVRTYVKMDSSYSLVPAASYTYIHTYTHTHTYVCTYTVSPFLCMYVKLYLTCYTMCVHTYVRICTYITMYVYVYACV